MGEVGKRSMPPRYSASMEAKVDAGTRERACVRDGLAAVRGIIV
jgi:hypothetical protein